MVFNDTLTYLTGKRSGFYKLTISPQSGKIKFYDQKNLPFYSCRHLLKDRDNNLWVATNVGLLHQNINRMYVQQVAIPVSLQKKFPNAVIDDIYALNGKLYVATHGAGILVFDRTNQEFIHRISFEKYRRHPESIYAMTSSNQNTLLVASNGPLFQVNT